MGFILTASTVAICPHGAAIKNITNYAKDPLIHGHTIWTKGDMYEVQGCQYGERRCNDVEWTWPSGKLFIGGNPVLTSNSIPNCRDSHMVVTGRGSLLVYQTEFAEKE